MALKITTYEVTVRLLEDMLGTVPKQKEVYASYIASRAADHAEKAAKLAEKKGDDPRWASGEKVCPPGEEVKGKAKSAEAVMEEEVETVPEKVPNGNGEENGKDDSKEREEKGWTGFHTDEKGNCFLYDYALKGFLCEAARTLKESGTVKQLQDKFKRYAFVFPRKNYVTKADEVNERPLRAMTAQGPRVTLARSDVVKAGFELSFKVKILHGGGITKAMLRDVLDYGQFIGLGQWRSGSWGRFEVVSLEELD